MSLNLQLSWSQRWVRFLCECMEHKILDCSFEQTKIAHIKGSCYQHLQFHLQGQVFHVFVSRLPIFSQSQTYSNALVDTDMTEWTQ